MWKHLYDQLGGHPGNTSAATCTRRIYEKYVTCLHLLIAVLVIIMITCGKFDAKIFTAVSSKTDKHRFAVFVPFY